MRRTPGGDLSQHLCMNHVAFLPSRPPSSCMRRITLLAVAASLALTATACSSSDGDAATTSTTAQPASTSRTEPSAESTSSTATSSTTTVSPSVPTEQELEAAVDAFWALYDELGASKAPFDPAIRLRLEERTSGEELATLFNYFQSNAMAGYYIRGGIESSLTVISATATEAMVRDCYDDLSGLYRISNDERVDTDDPARHQVVYTLVNENDVWKVSNILDEGSGCVVSS